MNPEEARTRFPVLDRLAYLNAGTTGPLSRATHAAMADWQERALVSGRAGDAYFKVAPCHFSSRTRVFSGLPSVRRRPSSSLMSLISS